MILSPMRILTLALMALTVSACQLRPTPSATFDHPDQIDRWAMSGKLGYRQ